MRVLVSGALGMVGRATTEHCLAEGDDVFAYDHRTLDITDASAISAAFASARPDVVINCAAWTDVDGCEADAERSFAVNARGPENLALNCRRTGASLITLSTDYVFDGQKDGFYTQRDDPRPQSVYAASKLEGERGAQTACARTMVVRTGWVFGAGGRNFLSRVIELSRSGARLIAISDAFGTPTYAEDLAQRLRRLAELDLPGIYHVTNSGDGVSYAEFTRAALDAARCEATIESISMDSLQRPAPRPRNSRLRCLLSGALGLDPLPFWLDSLRNFAASSSEDEKRGSTPGMRARLV